MCPHGNTRPVTKGSTHLSFGEYEDDLTVVEVCLDCGEVLDETEPVDNFDPELEII